VSSADALAADSYQTGRSAADRGVLLAHGAGSGRETPALREVADALAAGGVPSLRFDYPYRQRGRRSPDRAPVLAAATRDAAARLAARAGLDPGRLVLGGRSMGGRYCSLVAADPDDPVPALGLVLLGYPLHPSGKPDQLRVEHFPRLHVPCLFISGTRDSLAGREELAAAARTIPGPVSFHWLEGADHAYRPLKATGRSADDVVAEVADVAARWVTEL
jgi:predicted alpha/beta-hydrolase family hydrolase